MKYDYYAKKLEALWLRRKWWILGVGVLVSASAIVANIMLDTPESRIKKALIEYHQAKGQTVEIKDLSFRAVSANLPDSIRLSKHQSAGKRYFDLAIKWVNLENSQMSKRFEDSAVINYAQADVIIKLLESRGKPDNTFTRCFYKAFVTTNSEQFTDTVDVILNKELNVVWPDKK